MVYDRVPSVVGTKNVNDGKWHHIVGLFDGRELCLYVDGEMDNSATASRKIPVTNHAVHIGGNSAEPKREWAGLIDDMRIYGYALTEVEIKALYVESKSATKYN
ncbi:LamG domain-containing protein [Planctomycetota bacterium]